MPLSFRCGVDGGNAIGCPAGAPGRGGVNDGCDGGGWARGFDVRSLPSNAKPVVWEAGANVEVSWGFWANHGGGCKRTQAPPIGTAACSTVA